MPGTVKKKNKQNCQKYMAKEVVGPSGEPITVVLLSGRVVINMCVSISIE